MIEFLFFIEKTNGFTRTPKFLHLDRILARCRNFGKKCFFLIKTMIFDKETRTLSNFFLSSLIKSLILLRKNKVFQNSGILPEFCKDARILKNPSADLIHSSFQPYRDRRGRGGTKSIWVYICSFLAQVSACDLSICAYLQGH